MTEPVSDKTRQANRNLKTAIEAVLAADVTTASGETMTGAEVVACKLLGNAMKGDTKSIQMIIDLLYGRRQEIEMKDGAKLSDEKVNVLPGIDFSRFTAKELAEMGKAAFRGEYDESVFDE